jgi:hypothetical protein
MAAAGKRAKTSTAYASAAVPHTPWAGRLAGRTSSQDGDLTVVHRTVSLDPAADRRDLKPT